MRFETACATAEALDGPGSYTSVQLSAGQMVTVVVPADFQAARLLRGLWAFGDQWCHLPAGTVWVMACLAALAQATTKHGVS